MAVVHRLSKGVEISGDWVFGTGQAITLPTEIYLGNNGAEIEVYEGRNSFRMRNYHRMDIAMKFFKEKKWGERAWIISVYNVYNRQNPFFIYRGYQRNTNTPSFKQVSLFPIIPSVTYQFKF